MEKTDLLRKQLNEYFVGKEEVVDDLICCFLANGHILMEDVPGVGKTTLARCFASSLGLSFGRISFTPDTMPGDVTGMSVYDMKRGEFSYRAGAVMKNIVLADELNRTSPKTQSALLEAMAESQVTVDDKIYPLPDPFMVIATQNPMTFTGTYPLPEASLDRFMMRISIGYPDEEEELRMLRDHIDGKNIDDIRPVLDKDDVMGLREEVKKVFISDAILSYIRKIIASTRNENGFILGASPRALIHLTEASRAKAFLCGRDFVKPDDVKAVALSVLSHRMILSTQMRLEKKESSVLLRSLILKIPVPMERGNEK